MSLRRFLPLQNLVSVFGPKICLNFIPQTGKRVYVFPRWVKGRWNNGDVAQPFCIHLQMLRGLGHGLNPNATDSREIF